MTLAGTKGRSFLRDLTVSSTNCTVFYLFPHSFEDLKTELRDSVNKQLFHVQLHSTHKSRNMLVLMLCCVAKYTMNLILKRLCNA